MNMLIDFTDTKKVVDRYLLLKFKQSNNQGLGVFGGIGRTRQHEGKTGSYSTVEGNVKDKDYQPFSVEQLIDLKDIPKMGLADSVAVIEKKGREMGEKIGKYMFQTINKSIEESGNVVDAKGERFTLELMFQTLEKLEIPFDDDGNPQFPTLIIHPDMSPRIRELMAQEEKEKKYEERHKQLVEQKRKEWYEKQSNRKLVD